MELPGGRLAGTVDMCLRKCDEGQEAVSFVSYVGRCPDTIVGQVSQVTVY